MERNKGEPIFAECICPRCGLIYKKWLYAVSIVKYMDVNVGRPVILCYYCWERKNDSRVQGSAR